MSYIIETWPLLDGFAMEQMGQVTRLMKGQADPATREELMETYRQALNFYSHATELPPLDLESRAIIAKAHNRKGFTNAILSMAKADQKRLGSCAAVPSPRLTTAGHSSCLKNCMQNFPTDPNVRRFFAEALGTWGWGWMLMSTNRKAEAKPHYERAVQLLREQIRDAGASDGSDALGRAREGVTNVLRISLPWHPTVHTLASVSRSHGPGHMKPVTCEDNWTTISMCWQHASRIPDRRQFWAGSS